MGLSWDDLHALMRQVASNFKVKTLLRPTGRWLGSRNPITVQASQGQRKGGVPLVEKHSNHGMRCINT